MKSREEKLAYQRGYAARREKWPEHRPPMPPDEMVRGMYEACRALRDAVDAYLGTLDEDDELQESLGSRVDAVDAEFVKLGAWLKQPLPAPTPPGGR